MKEVLKNKNLQKVTFVKHWTDNLFSFKIKRPASFKFRSGEFVMIGLPDISGKPILRAYSIASPSWSEELEFYSIIVENGPLTSKLKNIKINDDIIFYNKIENPYHKCQNPHLKSSRHFRIKLTS